MSSPSSTKKVLVLNTGGTFNCVDSSSGKRPELKEEYLKVKLSPVSDGTEIKIDDIEALDSSNLHPCHWAKLAKAVEKNYKNYDGIVIIHGTDTLAYTASMLWSMLEGIPIPVVITGSQLSIANPIADALENMRASIYMAKAGYPGVFVAFDRKIILGKNVSKTHSMLFDAFESIDEMNFGEVNAYGMKINEHLTPKVDPDFKVKDKFNDKVFLLKLTPATKVNILDFLVEMGFKGIVIESFGLGGLPFLGEEYDFSIKCKELTAKGIRIVVMSQCTYGGTDLTIYETGKLTLDAGVQVMKNVSKEYAVTRLMWELENQKN